MKRFLLLTTIVACLSSLSFAQAPGISWGIGANVSFPSSDFGDAANTGFGGTGLVKFGLIPLVDLTGGIEYVSFGGKDVTLGTTSGESCATAWGYMVGGRVNLFIIAYGGLELGGYTFSSKFTVPSLPDSKSTDTKFFFAPMVGVNLGMLDAGIRYVVADTFDFFSIRGMVWF